jgi:molybdate transport system permease protein
MNPMEPVLLSLRVATIATAISLLAGLGLARLLTRKAVAFSAFWEALILLPMVFPPTITGYLLLILFGKRGPLGQALGLIGIHVVFTWPAAVIASVTVSLPLMYQNCKAALLGVDERYADAARTLGLSERTIMRSISLPLALPGILGGIALSFARALGEFGGTLMIAGNIPGRTQTMPLALYSAVEGGRDKEANFYLLVTVIVAFGLIAIVGICQKKAHFSPGRSAKTRRVQK